MKTECDWELNDVSRSLLMVSVGQEASYLLGTLSSWCKITKDLEWFLEGLKVTGCVGTMGRSKYGGWGGWERGDAREVCWDHSWKAFWYIGGIQSCKWPQRTWSPGIQWSEVRGRRQGDQLGDACNCQNERGWIRETLMWMSKRGQIGRMWEHFTQGTWWLHGGWRRGWSGRFHPAF